MSDEQVADSNNGSGTQNTAADEVSAREQLAELLASAQAAGAKIKACEDQAQNVLQQLNDLLVNATKASEKVGQAVPDLAATVTEVATNRAAVITHAKQVADVQKEASRIQMELTGTFTSAKQMQADIEAAKQAVDGAKTSATKVDADILNIKATSEANAAAVTAALDAAQVATATTKALADKATSVEQSIKDYETKLEELNVRCAEQLEAIKSLLPGATSAGLASAFDKRRETFLTPGRRWQITFVTSVLVLACIALVSLFEVYHNASTITYQQLLVLWASRVPVAAALVWLAMHASREAALAKRLEEDYGFKASVASSFQGFQEQMHSIGNAANSNEPLKALCDATLAQITNPPGRIYEKHALAVSPTSELVKAAAAVVEVAKVAKLPMGN